MLLEWGHPPRDRCALTGEKDTTTNTKEDFNPTQEKQKYQTNPSEANAPATTGPAATYGNDAGQKLGDRQ